MVSLAELKPKNYLTDPEHDNQLVSVIQININDGNEGYIREGYDGSGWYVYKTDIRKLNPINLTPEILEKCGFERKIILGAAEGYWYVQDGLSYNESHKGWWFRGSFPNGPQYLHQLQNLYYSLTGKELIYTP